VSPKFEGVPMVKAHRLVRSALDSLLPESLHGLTIDTRTPAQHRKILQQFQQRQAK
jgi:stress-induced morphogen